MLRVYPPGVQMVMQFHCRGVAPISDFNTIVITEPIVIELPQFVEVPRGLLKKMGLINYDGKSFTKILTF